jgi:hypothetical protein
MMHDAFDLNDIHHEPSDEQLAALMEEVAAEARRRAAEAREKLRKAVQTAIAESQRQRDRP